MLIILKFGICCLSKIIEKLSWLHSLVTVRVSLKDVTDNYKKTYPHIKKVELQAICAIEELEPDK